MDDDLRQLLADALAAGATIQIGDPYYGFDNAVTVQTPAGNVYGDPFIVGSPGFGDRLPLQLERVLRQAMGELRT